MSMPNVAERIQRHTASSAPGCMSAAECLRHLPEEKAALQSVRLAMHAVAALIEEADLTPKPGLVDQRGSGTHTDLDLELMHRSARSLFPCFQSIAAVSVTLPPSQEAREELARIGRQGEQTMFAATGGTNTHKGAIWALGLLVAGTVMAGPGAGPLVIADTAASIASHQDRYMPAQDTNGGRALAKYQVPGARGEAQAGFPCVVRVGLPILKSSRLRGASEQQARLNALLGIMSQLDDTCLLHRGGTGLLLMTKRLSSKILQAGGVETPAGNRLFACLDAEMLKANGSPGGSADLLAATLFMDSVTSNI